VIVRPQHILVPALTALLIGAIAPVANSSTANQRSTPARPASAGAHHQFVLTTPGGRGNDGFGSAVAIHRNLAIVGAPYRSVRGHRYAGAAYVFVKPKSGWGHAKVTAILTVAKSKARQGFGWSVAIAGNTIAVGAPGISSGTNQQQGSAYLFTKPAGGWRAAHHPTGRLFPSDRTSRDYFGWALAGSGSGNTFVVGAPNHVVGQHPQQGAAYVYQRPRGGWRNHTIQTGELLASDGVPGIQLGYSVAISGGTVVAGSPYVKVAGHPGAGAAYLFRKPATGWPILMGQAAKLTVRHPAKSQYLGYSVAIAGSTVAVGAPDTKVGTNRNQGASYVFIKPATGWHSKHQNATLTVSPGVKNAYFGSGLAASGNRIVGAAYGLLSVFYQASGIWHGTKHQQSQLTGTNALDFIGKAVGMSGSTIIAGAPTQVVGNHKNQGAAYVYVR
jgi:hypothetical protein